MGKGLRALDIWYNSQIEGWFRALSWHHWVHRGRNEHEARILVYAARR
jgi:hypothetical protein